ncbi:Serine palmitoyltransferase [Granulibacter bethesdensis]|uniref:Serine palmitoyltransferase n=1 Tax=Granulibacter bethesdensis TaxID=364410 RepID=A0AAC9P7G8_9PROT|nr:aminotransferase class I/II-fold pyridoxal phosphate-dependent enzyme [Granulibacter bethesdensis]APH53462.1 Serine palmitoyltransferase [Granulibacter bethesdensis]APH61040.1 Serine palmitoyltransferase [Granulibacter bethesdensis]
MSRSILAKFAPLAEARRALTAAGHDPFSVVIEPGPSASEGMINGQPTLLFGTNNYLGLNLDPAGINASAEAVREHGTGTTGSRIANGTTALHTALEHELAAFYGRKHAMVFSTGYQANLGILSTLAGKDDYLLLDADSHASIYDGSRLGQAQVIRFRHNDPEDLARRLRRLDGTPGAKLVVVEGIYSMLGDSCPLAEIAAVKREAGAWLLVDEAHSLGVLGARGRGLAEAQKVEADTDFIVGTFSKSLGSVGGFCVTDIDGFDILRVACRPYMFTASLPASVIASVQSALRQMQQRPALQATLRHNAETLHGGLKQAGFTVGPQVSPIVAVTMPDIPTAIAFWNALLARGVYVNLSLPPATPDDHPLLRSSVTASHTEQMIGNAIARFKAAAADIGFPL